LSRQADLESLQQQRLVLLGLGVVRQHHQAAIGGRHAHINHLHRRHLLQPERASAWCLQPMLQGDVQAIHGEDMGFDAFVVW